MGVADSGVNPHHPQVGSVAGGVELHFHQGRIHRGDDIQDLLGHGTAIAATIRGHAPDAELYSVRIFRRRLVTHIEILLAAIDWAAEQDLQLLNLSLGTTNPRHRMVLEAATRRAENRGLFVVAAAEANGTDSLPGGLPTVIGVMADPHLQNDGYYYCEPGGRLVASPWARALPGLPRQRNFHGVSLAVAHLTGFAARALEAQRPRSVAELREILCSETTAPGQRT